MPSTTKEIREFFERIAALEAKVDNLMSINKWQMGVVAAILIFVIQRAIFH